MAAISSLFGGRRNRNGKSGGRDPRRAARFRPAIERLEERKVMAVVCPATFVDDMTEWAQLYPTKTSSTVLHLNFEGQASQGVGAYAGTSREAEIQEILFRASEIFSPFNVQVRRIVGDGAFDQSSSGNTTIFIGDHPSNTFPVNGTTTNTAGAFATADYPSATRGVLHVINSDAFNVGYVDPWDGAVNWDPATIASAIGHEAGHTFGLAHVLSAPSQDMMSYDAANMAFLDQPFAVTDLNNTGNMGNVPTPELQPIGYECLKVWTPSGYINTGLPSNYHRIVTQNSFATLAHLLGRRATAGDEPNVADGRVVDPAAVPTGYRALAMGGSHSSAVDRLGDYDVYSFKADSTGIVRVDVDRSGRSILFPTVMVFRPDTNQLEQVQVVERVGSAEASFNAVAGRTYRLIVGGRNGLSSGTYRVGVYAGAGLGPVPTLDVQSLAASANGSADEVALETVSGTFRMLVNGKLVYSDRAADLRSVAVRGTSDSETFTLKQSPPFSLSVNGWSGANALVAPNAANQWLIQGPGSGTLNGTTSFSSMQSLKGGSAADTFAFTPDGRMQRLDGGGSLQDAIDYSRLGTRVVANLATGMASWTAGIDGIENVIGGSEGDELTGNDGVNVLRGGGGGDVLKGGGGNDTLYGDGGLDSLYGEGGMDFLDGGLDYLVDLLIGDYSKAVDEADIYINHMRLYGGTSWIPEVESNSLRPLDSLVFLPG